MIGNIIPIEKRAECAKAISETAEMELSDAVICILSACKQVLPVCNVIIDDEPEVAIECADDSWLHDTGLKSVEWDDDYGHHSGVVI